MSYKIMVWSNIWGVYLPCGQYLQFCGLYIIQTDKCEHAAGSVTEGDVIYGCTLHNIMQGGMG